ncbi:hypothetical protein BX265_0249 [Streptomyces sp. TLI_235]|nr:plasmid stabilization protein [Streptomyces sp. TLI_235]PBC75580.1 hypothetical protein BX265_0249 [Streptomyces sp. TLI_235]
MFLPLAAPRSAAGRQEAWGAAAGVGAPPGRPHERVRHGESRTAGRSSLQDMSSSRRGGQRSHSGVRGPTDDQLYNEAGQRDIHGRSEVNRAQLADALGR